MALPTRRPAIRSVGRANRRRECTRRTDRRMHPRDERPPPSDACVHPREECTYSSDACVHRRDECPPPSDACVHPREECTYSSEARAHRRRGRTRTFLRRADGSGLRPNVCRNRHSSTMANVSSESPLRRTLLSLDWLSLLVALALVALVRSGVLRSIPW